jgi:gamma-glutamyltranspeptidase/glutathione hydrolase
MVQRDKVEYRSGVLAVALTLDARDRASLFASFMPPDHCDRRALPDRGRRVAAVTSFAAVILLSRRLSRFGLVRPALAAAFAVAACVAVAQTQVTPQGNGAAPAASPEVRYDIGDALVSPVCALHGLVASEQHLATAVGVDILRRGGNAIDAAVAVGFALAVVHPAAGNLGGGGFMLIHDARSGRDVALDFREIAPAAASAGMFVDADGALVPGRSLFTYAAIGVPGSVAGLAEALRRYGTMPLARVIAPALALARDGFAVDGALAEQIVSMQAHLAQWPATRAIFFAAGQPLREGDRLVQTDLAASLQAIARDGPAAFYRGPIGAKIVADMARHGGLIERADLERYRVTDREPVRGTYRGYEIVSMPPPSSGGTQIIEALNLLEPFALAPSDAGSARAIHLLAETMKLTYADRSEFLGDPDFVQVPVERLIAKDYAAERRSLIDPEHATPSARIGPGRPLPHESDQTTQYTVADGAGNVVSTTTTLNLSFGSGIVAAGTGILLNDEMDDFVAKPGAPNVFGLTGGAANAIAPGKRPLSSMAPTLVLRDGRPVLATGSPGGSRIVSTTLEAIVDAIDFHLNPAEAALMPRVHDQWQPDTLRVEKGISADTLRLLEKMGHRISVGPKMGRSQTIQIGDGTLCGASDPRGSAGLAAGY